MISRNLPKVILLVALVISGCTSTQLVSNYDETIDSQAQALQKKLDAYFISLRSASGEELKYKSQQKFYEGVLADLHAMSVRAGGIYKNTHTTDQIDLATTNLAYLVLLHKQCITAPLTDDQKTRVKENGVDLSLDCKIENGASAVSSDKGESSINQFVLAPIQSQFNQHMGAIMAFELAKKRGEESPN